MKPVYSCYTFQTVNNKDADQTVHMHSLICIFVVHNEQIAGFSGCGSGMCLLFMLHKYFQNSSLDQANNNPLEEDMARVSYA